MMNLSKAVKSQLGTLALVLSVVEQVRVRMAEHSQVYPPIGRALARLQLDRDYCWQRTVEHYGIPWRRELHGTYILQLPERQHAQWKRFVADLHGQVMFRLPESAQREDGRIDAHAWMNAVLIRTTSQADAIPWNDKSRTLAWGAVVGSLQALYEIYDPNLDHAEAMRQGAQWAEGLRV